MAWKDDELTEEELMSVKAGITSGNVDETLNLMGKEELGNLKEKIEDKELTFDELDNVKAGMPQDAVDEYKEENSNLFRK